MSAGHDDEVTELRRRVAQLEGRAPAAPPPPQPPSRGPSGCLIALGVVGTLIVGLAMCAVIQGGAQSDRIAEGRADPEDLHTMCPAIGSEAERLAPRIGPLETSLAAPEIILPGPPMRIRCGFLDAAGRPLFATADIVCTNPLEADCARLVSVMGGSGRVYYLNRAARSR